jgi:flagellar basal body-associated protein FliL
MEDLNLVIARRRRNRRIRHLIFIALGILLVVLAIAIPVGFVLSRRSASKTVKPQLKATVLVPLYIYPSPGAWDPLFSA